MDGGGEGGLAAWLIDVASAALFGAAVAYAGTALGTPLLGWAGGSIAMMAALVGLRLVPPEPQRFALPLIALEALSPELPADVLELTEPEPLLLEDVLTATQPNARVVRLFARPPLPTAGELVQRIESHLGRDGQSGDRRTGEVVQLPVDASAALREALADLRRSLG